MTGVGNDADFQHHLPAKGQHEAPLEKHQFQG